MRKNKEVKYVNINSESEDESSDYFQIITLPKKKVLNLEGMIMKEYKKETCVEDMMWVEKYRPKHLDDIVSHKTIITMFKEATKEINKPIPHMILFGPPGTGKTSIILALARGLYGPNIYKERVYEFNASDERGIDSVRYNFKNIAEALIGKMDPHYPCPPYKLIILDEADTMTQDAQSALRIIIEENSKNTRFILICNNIHPISSQIISRCAKLRFPSIDDSSVEQRLISIATKEKLINKLDKNVIPTIIQLINGDLRKGITLLQRCAMICDGDKKITKNNIYDIMGIMPNKILKTYLKKCVDMLTTRNAIKSVMRFGYMISPVLEQLIDIILDDNKISEIHKANLCLLIAKTEKKLIEGANEELQLTHVFTSYVYFRSIT
jgi:replication factor C subunit 2/4